MKLHSTKIITVGFLLWAMSGCRPSNLIEISREASPDLRWEAVFAKEESEATLVNDEYFILLCPAGIAISEGCDVILEAQRVDTIGLNWQSPTLLNLQISDATIKNFRSYWFGNEHDPSSTRVDIRLTFLSKSDPKSIGDA